MKDFLPDEPPAARADQRRNDELILQTAARLLATDPGVSMRAIADAAGLARPTVYRRYPNREALEVGIRATVEATMMRALDGVGSWRAGPATLHDLLHALITVGRRYPFALVVHRTAPLEHSTPVDRRIIDLLASGQRAGVLRDDIDAELLNTVLFGVVSAVVRRYPQTAPDTLAADVARLFVHP